MKLRIMKVNTEIIKVRRLSDNKEFELLDPIEIDGVFQGVIVRLEHIEGVIKVLVDDDSEGGEGTTLYPIEVLD